MKSVVLDTTLLSNFSQLQRPDLIQQALGNDVSTTPHVMAELRARQVQGLVPACDWSWLAIWEPTPEEQTLSKEFSSQIDLGEAECLAVAVMRRCKFLSDDFAARRVAKTRGLEISGTLGVRLLLVDRHQMTLEEADAFLNALVLSGFRSPVQSLRELSR